MVLPDAFYFEADDGTHGRELWRSDGTEAGTYMVKNIVDGASGSRVQPVFAAGGYVYMHVYGAINGYVTNRENLWRTDGTEAGTEPVINLETGGTFLSGGVINRSRVVGNNLYFVSTSTESERGTELWLIEPEAPLARPVSDLHQGPGSSNGSFLGEAGGFELLSAYVPGVGQELYAFDPAAIHPPYATTRGATAVATTSATLQGLVYADGQPMTATFEYGPTLDLGTSVPLTLTPPDDPEPQTVSYTLTGLTPGMTYFYRLRGTNSVGSDSGGIRSFRTVGSNASLAFLTAGSATLTPAFQAGILAYQVTVPAATSAALVGAEALDPTATVSIDGPPFQARFRSTFVTTNPGTTHVSIEVLAQDGVSSQIYTLTIIRPPAPEIAVSGGGTNIVDGDSSPSTTDRTDHGPVELGSSGLFLFTVSNAGTEPLTIQAPVISGTHADDFTVISAPGPTIAPGISSLLLVTFTPSALGTRNAAISFANNDGDETPFNFSIRGTGIVPQVPEIVVEHPAGTVLDTNPAAIDFGSTAVAATGATREIVIRNTGTSPLQDIYTGISGLAENDFILDAGTLGTSLAPGGMATITVTFNPTKGGLRNAVLEITSNDADENPFLINLSGVGVKSYDFTYSQNALNVDANGTLVLSFPAVANSPFQIAENSQTILPQFQSYNFINTCAFGNYPYSFSRNGATTVNGIARTGNINQPISFTLCAGSLSIGASQPVSWTLDAGGGDTKTLSLVIGAGTGGWMPGTFTLSEVNDPPVAVITDPPATIPLGTTLNLDGSASYDLDGSGHIAAWDWDLDNDGIYELSGPIIEVPGEQFPATWLVNTGAQIRLRVTDNSGSTHIQLITPTILPEPVPTFQLLAPTDVRVTRATLNATINPNSYASWAYIDWGTNSNYGSTLFLSLDPSDGTNPQSVSGVLEYLTASTTYYYRLAVGNDYGAFYSEEASFTTPSPAGLLGTTVAAAGLTGDDALPTATPFGDGVPNLLKYAFNMNLAGPDASTLPPGSGTSGLPSITTPEGAPPGTLRFEFLRRKGSGLVYAPQKSTTLDNPSWSPVSAVPVVTSINDQWERVVYTEAPDPIPAPACFGRVEVVIP
jgi:ELWxxDGT repeat protein